MLARVREITSVGGGWAPGVVVASSVAINGHALTLGLLWRRFHTSQGLEGILRTLLQMPVSASLAAFLGWLAADAVTGGGIPGFTAGLTAALAGLAVAYLTAALMMGSVEARSVVRHLLKRCGPPAGFGT